MFHWIKIFSIIKCQYKNDRNSKHNHAYFQMGYILEGQGCLVVSNVSYFLKKNDVFLIQPDEPHFLYADSMVSFEFKFNVLHDQYRELLKRADRMVFDFDNKIRRMLDRINGEVLKQEEFYVDLVKLEFAKILLTYFKYADNCKDRKSSTLSDELYTDENDHPLFHEVIRYIHENHHRGITLQELSKVSKMGLSNFIRKFKTTYGIAPIQYVNFIRLSKAKELLKYSKLSISEIADRTGFGSSFYFSRYFSKSEGLSPTEYKSKMVNKFIMNIDFLC